MRKSESREPGERCAAKIHRPSQKMGVFIVSRDNTSCNRLSTRSVFAWALYQNR
jgi:hypothetical protein